MYGHTTNKASFPIVLALLAFYMVLLTSCGEKAVDISLMSETDTFYQSTSINNKLDIMFVVDNSGSMADEQNNLATNFNAFMQDFITKSYDFRISVVGTDSWKTQFTGVGGFTATCNVGTTFSPNNQVCARLRDGSGTAPNHSGVFVIDNNTPDPNPGNGIPGVLDVFNMNVRLGTNGYGDERAFQSFMNALDYNVAPNNSFLRSDSFLAIIIVSDEEDYSYDSHIMYDDYANPDLYTINEVVSYLDTKTNSTPTSRRYNVSSIASDGVTCNGAEGNDGLRYAQLADATSGVKGSICDANFSASLTQIQNQIAVLSTQFYLSRRPDPSTIVVTVNGVVVPENGTNGWSYNSTNNSVMFHGTAIPSQGAAINIDFDPVEVI